MQIKQEERFFVVIDEDTQDTSSNDLVNKIDPSMQRAVAVSVVVMGCELRARFVTLLRLSKFESFDSNQFMMDSACLSVGSSGRD